jgi:hypothetical protein
VSSQGHAAASSAGISAYYAWIATVVLIVWALAFFLLTLTGINSEIICRESGTETMAARTNLSGHHGSRRPLPQLSKKLWATIEFLDHAGLVKKTL